MSVANAWIPFFQYEEETFFEDRRIRTVVVDDSPGYLEVICALLELEETFDIVGRASNGADAIQAVAHLQPDLLLIDVQMPLIDGLTAAAFLAEHFPLLKIVLMSAEDAASPQIAALSEDGWVFVHKPHFKSDFLPKFRALLGSGRRAV